jgi:hypothetical protein
LTEEVRALVEGRSFAYVASTGEDGSPDVVPVWLRIVEVESARVRQLPFVHSPSQ